MKAETLKLGLIERLRELQNVSTLRKVEKSIIQAEMETRAEESVKAVKRGEVLSIDEFRKENGEWAKERFTR